MWFGKDIFHGLIVARFKYKEKMTENNERSDYVFCHPRNPTYWRIIWDLGLGSPGVPEDDIEEV